MNNIKIYRIISLALISSACLPAQALDYTLHTFNYTNKEITMSGENVTIYGSLSFTNNLIGPAITPDKDTSSSPTFHNTQGGDIIFQGSGINEVQGHLDFESSDGTCHVEYWYGWDAVAMDDKWERTITHTGKLYCSWNDSTSAPTFNVQCANSSFPYGNPVAPYGCP